MNEPIPKHFKDRVKDLVRELRPSDFEEAIRSVKVTTQEKYFYDYIFFRIEAGCRNNICMTVLAVPRGQKLVAAFVLNAGPWLYKLDTWEKLWGENWTTILFPGANNSYIIAQESAGQFAFSACNACYGFPESYPGELLDKREEAERSRKPSERLMVPYEEFRQQIGRSN